MLLLVENTRGKPISSARVRLVLVCIIVALQGARILARVVERQGVLRLHGVPTSGSQIRILQMLDC